MKAHTTQPSLQPSGRPRWYRYLACLATLTAFAVPLVSPTVAEAKPPRRATTTTVAPTTTAAPVPGSYPTAPPAQICGNSAILNGPSVPPAGAVTVPSGDNSGFFGYRPVGTTFWFAPGLHTLGTSEFGQIVPADNTTFIGAPGAILDGQGINRYAFTQKAANVTVKHLTVTGFRAPGDEGVVNHDYGPGWVIERNTISKNNGAGVMLGDNNRLAFNCLADNGQYGFQGFGKNLTIDRNELARNNVTDWETKQPGCGCSGGSKFWDSGPGTVTNNWVHDNHNVGLWWDNNNLGYLIEGNLIEGNRSHGLFYETSYNARIVNNTFRRNALPVGREFQARNDSFPVGAIYISESGGDARLNGGVYPTLEIKSNLFEDNWGGIVGWENADRFGHDQSANTSKGYTTLLVDPTGLSPSRELSKCGNPATGGKLNQDPYTSDCRWKTKNLLITNNKFSGNKAAIGCSSNLCNRQALFSNFGTMPSWSLYKGRVVQQAITFAQQNVWRSNTYVGDWHFTAYEMGTLTWDQWRTAPYNQDGSSTYSGAMTTVPSTTTTTTTTPPTTTPLNSGNALDVNTAGLEGSIGTWIPWFSSTVSRSHLQAHTGSYSLRVDVTAPYGWGVQLSNYPGFPTTAGNKTISFWGLLGAGATGASMNVKWRDATGAVVKTDTVSLPNLTTTWQHVSMGVVAPVGTTAAWVELGGTSAAGTVVFFDDMVVSG